MDLNTCVEAIRERRVHPPMSLRIAHVTATFPPYWGGTGNVAYHNARALHERGHEVTVLTALAPGRFSMQFPFPVEYLPAAGRIGNAPFTPSLLSRTRGFDIIHLHMPYIFGSDLSAASAAIHHTPLVVTYHNDLLAPGMRGRAFRFYSAMNQRLILRRADQVIVTSLDYGRHSEVAGAGRLRRQPVELPNGVDTTVFHPDAAGVGAGPGVPPGSPFVLFVGAMDSAHHFKGIPVLIDALSSLPQVHAVLVGDGDLRARYMRQAEDQAPGRVHFLGSVPLTQLVCLYRSAAVTVLPSITRGEAFGVVLLESLACGTPVIATDLPGVRSVVDDGIDGFLVPPGDGTALADAVARMIDSPSLRTAMGARGLEKVQRLYRWDGIAERLEGIYRDIVGRDCSPGGVGTNRVQVR